MAIPNKKRLINLLNQMASEALAPKELQQYDKVTCPECGKESVAIFAGIRDENNKRVFYSQCCMATI